MSILMFLLATAPTISNVSASIPTPCAPIPVITEDEDAYWNEIVPGEVIIMYKNTVDVKNASAKQLGIAEKGVTFLERGIDNKWIVVKVEGGIPEEKAFIKNIKAKSMVEFAEPNRIYRPAFTPNDPYFTSYPQWDKTTMNAPGAWDHGLGDTSVSVGIIDMGTCYTHPDLSARFGATKGYDFYSSDSDPINGSGEWHATHCAGIACATINNGAGIAGFANCRLYALRFMSSSSGSSSALANSIIWCINNGVWVLSISAAGTSYSNTIDTYTKAAWNAGRLLFAATGNNGTETFCYPAADTGVLAIGGMSQAGSRLSYSNYGSHIKFVAPGEVIYSTYPSTTYYTSQGTSMACPGAAGGAALVWSMNQSRTNAQIRDILIATATDISPSGWDKYTGYGKLNLDAAVDLAIAVEEFQTTKFKFDISPTPATNFLNIKLCLPASQNISLKIFNSAGKMVKTIFEENKQAGDYNTTIGMEGLSSGIYFVKLLGKDINLSKKITLIK